MKNTEIRTQPFHQVASVLALMFPILRTIANVDFVIIRELELQPRFIGAMRTRVCRSARLDGRNECCVLESDAVAGEPAVHFVLIQIVISVIFLEPNSLEIRLRSGIGIVIRRFG